MGIVNRCEILHLSLMQLYDADMRTTVDLPPALYQRVKERAADHQQSMSSTLASLVSQGLDLQDETTKAEVEVDPVSGFPVISIGRAITSEEVARLIEED